MGKQKRALGKGPKRHITSLSFFVNIYGLMRIRLILHLAPSPPSPPAFMVKAAEK